MTSWIIQGDALEVMPGMDAESVQCVVTSPPYWSLRDYKLPGKVWGGDGDCEHEWGDATSAGRKQTQHSGAAHKEGFTHAFRNSNTYLDHIVDEAAPSGNFCRLCGAWRGCLGLEPTPELYVEHIVEVFRGVRRVLRKDGTIFLNLGDSYANSGCGGSSVFADGRTDGRAGDGGKERLEARREATKDMKTPGGLKAKDLLGMPWRVAFALQADGWWLRSGIVWAKGISFCPTYSGSVMPESCTDRPTSAYEMVFLLTKSKSYHYDAEAVREVGTIAAGTLAAKGSEERKAENGVNARPAEYAEYTGTRNLRNVWAIPAFDDFLAFASVHTGNDLVGLWTQYQAAWNGLQDCWAINPEPFSAALCKGCRKVYDPAPKNGICPKCGGTEFTSHFATFPTALVEPCVKAGSSHKACGICGAPWERVVEVERTFESGSGKAGNLPEGKNGPDMQGGGDTLDVRRGPCLHTTTTGWRPTCSCMQVASVTRTDESGQTWPPAPTKPCVVLDPFAGGSGRVGLVCKRLGRDFIGIELNQDYAEMSEQLLGRDVTQEMFV